MNRRADMQIADARSDQEPDSRETLRAMPPPSWSDFPSPVSAALRSYRAPKLERPRDPSLEVLDAVRDALAEEGDERCFTLEFDVEVQDITIDV